MFICTAKKFDAAMCGQTHLRQDQVRLKGRQCMESRDQIAGCGNLQLTTDQDVSEPCAFTRRRLDQQHVAREIV